MGKSFIGNIFSMVLLLILTLMIFSTADGARNLLGDNSFGVTSGSRTLNNIQQCSNNKSVKLLDANVAINILAAGNANNKDLCQVNNSLGKSSP
ncbi:hypothetical protein MKX01_042806 [Papaver californicum]|nr:hypothetical protein MKX01_042806 [Papaver californicum]